MNSSVSSLLIVIGLWLVLGLLCCGGVPRPVDSTYKVTYRIDGNGSRTAYVLFMDERDATVAIDVDLPWTRSFQTSSGRTLALSARNTDGIDASITASIIVNGKIVDDQTAGGRIDTAVVT